MINSIAILAGVFIAAATSAADERCVPPPDPDPIRLSSGFKWPHTGPKHTGIFPILMTELYCRIGRRVDILMVPPARSIAQTNIGLFAGEGPRRGLVADRYEDIIRVMPALYDLRFMAFSVKPLPAVKSYADLVDLRVVTVIGRKGVERRLDEVMDGYFRVPSEELAFNLLVVGRADVVVIDDFTGIYYAEKAKITNLNMVELERHAFNLLLHKSQAALVPALSVALTSMHEEGIVERVIDQHLNPPTKPE